MTARGTRSQDADMGWQLNFGRGLCCRAVSFRFVSCFTYTLLSLAHLFYWCEAYCLVGSVCGYKFL